MTSTHANIVLTGFMGTGKSTVGRLLAHRLGREFVDTDTIIEERHGPIPAIFSQYGEQHFRDLERGVAAELSQRDGMVIATGGRMLLDPENARMFTAAGLVFCLTATAEEILARVVAQEAAEGLERPMLGSDPAERIKVLLAERVEGYGRYRQVATSGRLVKHIVDELIELTSAEQHMNATSEEA